jgi:hypothetical protein
MRKFLVKHFALDYTTKIFGRHYNAPRASRIIFPLMVISGWFSTTNPDWPNPTPLVWFLYSLLATSLFFGFIYFRFYPAKWEELDNFQKFQYGVFKQEELSLSQFEEWKQIFEELDSTF